MELDIRDLTVVGLSHRSQPYLAVGGSIAQATAPTYAVWAEVQPKRISS